MSLPTEFDHCPQTIGHANLQNPSEISEFIFEPDGQNYLLAFCVAADADDLEGDVYSLKHIQDLVSTPE